MKTILRSFFLLALAGVATNALADPVVWQYNPSAKTITDGNWTIVVAASGSNLTLQKITANPDSATTLDLGDVVCSDGSTTYTITRVENKFWGNSTAALRPTEIIFPKTTVEIGKEAFKFAGDPNRHQDLPYLTRVYIESDSLKLIEQNAFSDGGAPEDTTILAPNLETIRANAFWQGQFSNPKITNDVSRVIPRGVKFLGSQAFAYQSKMPGELILDNVDTLEAGVFTCKQINETSLNRVSIHSDTITTLYGNTFYQNGAITRMVLDMPQLEVIEGESMTRTESLAEIVIGARQLVSCGNNPMWESNSSLTNMVMAGFCPVDLSVTIDKLLASVNADYKCRLSVDKTLGWKEIAEPLTEAERARADFPGPATFGTYKGSVGNKKRVWLVHAESPYREKAMVIYLK